MKRNFYIGLFVISMCMIILGFVGIGYANHQGYDCSVCHDSVDTRNLHLIREVIFTPNSGPKEIWFTAYTGWRSYADGDTVYDGICEVCHTVTRYHRNDGTSMAHYDGQDCTGCHPHSNDFYPTFVGGQSHFTHFNDPKGPQLGTDACFTACHLSSSDFRIFKDNQPIETTNVCDACHSPSGSFNGVGDMNPGNPNSVAYGAKYNWGNGIYEPVVPPEPWPSRLKAGKENWCATCHDDGVSVIKGVSAPNVMGDNTTYGYNVSGHGRDISCDYCHDLTILHTDGNARTYSASSNNYREGYRLNVDMAVPRYGEYGPSAFALCFNCHLYSYVMGPRSNFRNDNTGVQLHETHLSPAFAHITSWDSDWNQNANNCNQGECADSAISCTSCHNVHGSPTPAMIRHGELISTPGTTDKVPALSFRWYKADGSTQTMVLEESRWGGLLCGIQPYNVSFNHVCWGCHTTGELRYYRIPLPTIGYSPTSFSFTATQGGLNPSNQTLSITNTGGGTLNWSVIDNAAWLSLSPTNGTDTRTVTLSVNIAGLTAGTYNATIIIAATGATNSPVTIPVTLIIKPVVECSFVPDNTTIPRGGTLGLQATVTNNTDQTISVLAATRVTLPNGNWYPSSGYLFGPINVYLGIYQSKSGHLSHAIPLTAPLGTYTYHGYVGNYGVGIYDECTFTFQVTSSP